MILHIDLFTIQKMAYLYRSMTSRISEKTKFNNKNIEFNIQTIQKPKNGTPASKQQTTIRHPCTVVFQG